MLNGLPVLTLCCFTCSILDLICISAFIVYLFFFLLLLGDIWNKSKMLQQTRETLPRLIISYQQGAKLSG